MKERETLYLLPQRHPTAQSTGQTDDFGHKRLERQVLLQDHPPQYRLHLRDTWTWEMKEKEMPGGMMEGREKVSIKKAIKERDAGNKWRVREGGWWGAKLIDIHVVFCMHILSELHRMDFLHTWLLRRIQHVLGGLMVHYRANYIIQTQIYDQELEM